MSNKILNLKSIAISCLIVLILYSILSGFIFAYDDKTTHPAITDEIVDFYNLSFDNKLTAQEKEWIVQGAMNEDTPPRWINHFYDPIYKDGWSGEETGIWPTLSIQYLSSVFLSSEKPVSSLSWLHNQELQSKYGAYQGNRTWERAIYEMVKNGNKREAYYTLGFILHLIEDATVPDHTRNDTHAHELRWATGDYGSPYEEFSKQYTRETLNIAKEFKQKGDQPIIKSSIDDYLISLAEYSNKYFFSKDTINDPKYKNPKIIRTDEDFGYGKDENEEEFQLVNIDYDWSFEKFDFIKIYYLPEKDNNALVLKNYFSRLSRAAVLNGAGVINLFHQEVAKAEKEKLQELPKESSAIWSVFGRGTQIYNFVSSIFDDAINEIVAVIDKADGVDPMDSVANIGQIANEVAISLPAQAGDQKPVVISNEQSVISLPDQGLPAQAGDQQSVQIQQPEIIHAPFQRSEVIHAPYNQQIQSQTEIQNQNISEITVPVSTGSIGGSFVGVSIEQNDSQTTENTTTSNQINDQQTNTQIGGGNVTLPAKPVITTNSGQDLIIQKFASQYPERQMGFVLEGTKAIDISKIRVNDAIDIITPESINWQKEVILLEGENIFAVTVEDDAGNISDSATIKISLQFDNSTFYLTDYDIRKMDFILNWGDTNGVIKEWELEQKIGENFAWINLANSSLLTANSYSFVAKYDDMIYQFRLRGKDANGNFSDYQYLNAEISTNPVVINEIAWRGTEAHFSDEWIELANKTNQEIDLNGWILKTQDATINRTLTGKIAANGFYLLERTNDNTISNIAADQTYTGALRDAQNTSDRGDPFYLYDKDSNIVDQTRTTILGREYAERVFSSERISIWSNANYLSNWEAYKESGSNALDADGNPVYGTPRAKNSQADKYFALNSGVFQSIPTINKDTIFLKSRGPYMANGSVQIMGGVNLTIEPGTELNFNNFGLLSIYDGSRLIAKGAENNKIIVKSSTSSGTAIFILNSTAEIDNVEMSGGSITIDNSNVVISNSVIKNAPFGLITLSNNSIFNISNSEFSGDRPYDFSGNYYSGEAILIKQSQGNVKSSTIKNNRGHGIYVDSLSGTLDILGNNFSSNGIAPIATNGFIDLNLENNTIGANDALMIYNPTVKAGEEVTIFGKMPYFLYPQTKGAALYQIINPKIEIGGILRIEPGAVIRFYSYSNNKSFLEIYGRLEAAGTIEQPMIFMWQYDYGLYGDIVGNVVGAVAESDYMQFYDGSEAVLENVITRQKVIDQYNNVLYKSYWLVRQ